MKNSTSEVLSAYDIIEIKIKGIELPNQVESAFHYMNHLFNERTKLVSYLSELPQIKINYYKTQPVDKAVEGLIIIYLELPLNVAAHRNIVEDKIRAWFQINNYFEIEDISIATVKNMETVSYYE